MELRRTLTPSNPQQCRVRNVTPHRYWEDITAISKGSRWSWQEVAPSHGYCLTPGTCQGLRTQGILSDPSWLPLGSKLPGMPRGERILPAICLHSLQMESKPSSCPATQSLSPHSARWPGPASHHVHLSVPGEITLIINSNNLAKSPSRTQGPAQLLRLSPHVPADRFVRL